MSVVIKQVGLVGEISDLATGGAIVLPVGKRIEQYRALTVTQTTAAQTLTLPAPIDATVVFGLQVSSIGSASFTMYGVTLNANATGTFYWNGTVWSPDATPMSSGTVVEDLVPTAQNVVPDLSVAPRAGTPIKVFVNGKLERAGIAVSGAGVITVTPATLGYNLEVVDTVAVEFYV